MILHTFGSLPFGQGTFLGGTATLHYLAPDLIAAIVVYWSDTEALRSIHPQLYYDEGPAGEEPPYVVLSQVGSRDRFRNTGRGYGEDLFLQFALYDDDQDEAVTHGLAMREALNLIQDNPLQFEDGKLKSWFWSGQRLTKTRERGRNGRILWQQSHTYRATIVRVR